MKKLIALIMIAGLLLTGTIAYAEEAAGTDTLTKRSNRAEIIRLRQDATALYKETKKKVKELFKSEDDISQTQIEAIKQAVDILVEDKKLLIETRGDIFKESIDLRLAKRNRDVEAFKAALDDIISIQNSKIDILNKVIEDLKAIQLI